MSGERLLRALRRHEGVWEGRYRHIDTDGALHDIHASRVECEFPASGPYVYVQRNTFTWADGRTEHYEFGGVLAGDRVVWDTDRFSGHAWATDHDVLLLRLDRKDQPGVSFIEIIALDDGREERFRTWHWFRDGVPFRRTLCDEHRVTRK